MLDTKYKDPDATLDYTIPWANSHGWDIGDTIVSSEWTAETGITITGSSYTPQSTTVWLSGGVILSSYIITNRIITTAGRVHELSFKLSISNM